MTLLFDRGIALRRSMSCHWLRLAFMSILDFRIH